MSNSSLFEPVALGSIKLSSRIVMAPMTRSRAVHDHAADDLTAKYYAQRASAGLIITEGSPVSRQGQGYLFTPGIHSAKQVEGWRAVVDAVRAAGGVQFIQLWHVGRISHTTLQPDQGAPISSTDKPAAEVYPFAYDADGRPAPMPASIPRKATLVELRNIVEEFRKAAHNAEKAGFDGVEIHAANGYLFDQFLSAPLNERDDAYDGTTQENRTRLLLEVFDAVADVLGSDRVGVRISPFGTLHDMPADPTTEATFLHLAREFRRRGALYLHIVRSASASQPPAVPDRFLRELRSAFAGPTIVTGGLDRMEGERLLRESLADLVGYASAFIANPDLPVRLRNDWPLATADASKVYGGGAEGYTDYPSFSGA